MNKKPLRLIHVRDIINTNYPGNKWLVENLMPSEAITLLTGAPASFKTFISIHLAQCVAERKDFLGQFKVPYQRNVLVLDKENNQRDLKERFVSMDMYTDASIQYVPELETFLLTDDKDIDELLRKIEEHEIGLLIIDSLRRFHKGEENSSGEMAIIFDNLRKITSRGVSIVIIHHHRKEAVGGFSSSNSIRGSSDIFAAVDCHIALDFVKEKAVIAFNQHKLRQARAQDEFAVKVLTDEETQTKVWFEFVGDYDRKRDKNTEVISSVRTVFGKLSTEQKLSVKQVNELTESKYREPAIRFALNALTEDGFLIKTNGENNRGLYQLASPSIVENPVLEIM